jgi:hypothetical protein
MVRGLEWKISTSASRQVTPPFGRGEENNGFSGCASEIALHRDYYDRISIPFKAKACCSSTCTIYGGINNKYGDVV